MRELLRSLNGNTPESGVLQTSVDLGGYSVSARGAVVQGGEARYGVFAMSNINVDGDALGLRRAAVLLWVLSEYPDSVAAEVLYSQVPLLLVTGGSPLMVEVGVRGRVALAEIPDGPLPVRCFAVDDADEAVGEVLVWVTGGVLSALEYAWYTDDAPDEFPAPRFLRSSDSAG